MRFASKKIYKSAVFACAMGLIANAAALTLDDFVPPSEGGRIEPENPVKESGDVVVGSSMQDTMGYAYTQLMREGTSGVKTVQTKTGLGILATGTASYNLYENINATLLSKRQAYVLAFTNAQGQMVKHLDGFKNNCRKSIESNVVALDTGNEGLGNSEVSSSEVCSEITSGVLSGYITYAVDDNVEDNSVSVTIASSTKTRSAMDRVGGAVIGTSDVGKAFEHVAREISQGLVPPLGAKMIMNPDSGEAIVIGFGSAIIRDNKNPSMKSRMQEMASRQSQVRANNSLVSFLNNSEVYWDGGFEEAQLESAEQFEIPVDRHGRPGDPKAFGEMRNKFINVTKMSDDYQVITKGRVPSGVKTKTFVSEDGYWMNTIAIYMSSSEASARQAGTENRRAANASQDSNSTTGRPVEMDGGLNSGSRNPQGPSGRVVQDNDF